MVEDFRIARFISTILLLVEETILLAGTWFYSIFSFQGKLFVTFLCLLSQIIVHLVKDENRKLYIIEDFAFVWMINICMGIVYRNMYVTLVCSLFYFVKSINFRDKRLVKRTTVVYIITAFALYFIDLPDTIVNFDLFITHFVCICFLLAGSLTTQLIAQVNSMIDDAFEQETSLDDLLHLVENKVNEAEYANKAKGQFLANMSHEIRTPINAVLGFDTMILRECKDVEILKYAKDIQNAGQTLLALINDILDFSKIEAGKMELLCEEYNILNIVDDVENLMLPKILDKKLELIIEVDENVPCGLYGDNVRIKQIMVNLLSNAVKYTPKGSVKLTVKADCFGGRAQLNVSVKDTGIGISPEDISKLSEEFVRIEESRNKNIEGTGLGMNIVISLLQLMNSNIEVDSVYGEGSDFHFTIEQPIIDETPVGNRNDNKNSVEDFEEYQSSFCIPDCRLLVVDDNAINRKVFIGLLKDLQCSIDEAESGKECLDLVKKVKYDIVFMDHMMPEMDGVETFRHMKEMRDYPNANTPVVILTANAISGAMEEYLSKGFNAYLTKPIDVDKLENTIGMMISEEKKMPSAPKPKKAVGEQETKIEWPFIDGVDWQNAVQMLKSENLLRDSVDGFSLMAKSDLKTLKGMYDALLHDPSEANFGDFRIKVHSMKSNVATIGAYHVAGLAKYLEYAARDHDLETINNLMATFEKQWNILKASIDEAFHKQDEAALEEKDLMGQDELFEYLDLLMTAIGEFDFDRVDAIMEELGEHSYTPEQAEQIEELKVQAMNMDEDACLAIVEALKSS